MKIALTIVSIIAVIATSTTVFFIINDNTETKTENQIVSNVYKVENIETLDENVEINPSIINENNTLVLQLTNNNENQHVDVKIEYYDYEDNLIKTESIPNGIMKTKEENIVLSRIPYLYNNYAGKIKISTNITVTDESIPDHDAKVETKVLENEDFKAYELRTTVTNTSNQNLTIGGYDVLLNDGKIVAISGFSASNIPPQESVELKSDIFPYDNNITDIDFIEYDEIKTYINETFYN